MSSSSHSVRLDDAEYAAAKVRAAAEGTSWSVLVQKWTRNYGATGSPVLPKGKRPLVKLTVAEQRAVHASVQDALTVADAMPGVDLAALLVDAINRERAT